MIPVLILAAGQSRRMRGADKLMERIGDQPLIRRQAEAALCAGLQVTVALPALDHPRHQAVADLPVRVIFPPEAAEGMGGTLRAGVAALPVADAFMVLLADLPELTAPDLQTMCAAMQAETSALIWQGADCDGKPGHPVIFAASLRQAFADLAGDVGAKPVIKAHQSQRHLVRLPAQHATRDLDTPEEWAAWRAAP